MSDIFAEMQRLLNQPAAQEKAETDLKSAEAAQAVIAAMTETMPQEKPKLNRRTAAQVKADAAAAQIKADAAAKASIQTALLVEADAIARLATETAKPVSIVAEVSNELAEELEKELVQEQPKPFVPGKIQTLLIDCLAVGCLVVPFSKILVDVEKTLGGDYRLGDENSFGKGPGRLLNALRTTLAGHELPVVYIESARPESAICLNYLESISQSVIRGIR